MESLKLQIDNGPEPLQLTLEQWAKEHGMILGFIKSGKPTQNAFTERFNLTYLTEILDLYSFRMPNEVREMTSAG
ncbi:TPA: transposase [Klebsiella variicola subsp. variicola]|uniref:integrase core domain-containing protein n=1 Tax=Klebsiella variicola TaxID=244366 RepID=UPI0004A004C8|nr:hypothetical protein AD94_02811 [Klebsiella variicola]HCI4280028.1 transposase [Klebsiella variicola subsp. variicola]HCI4624953.1 transposase [Klebsiella variicola subsp. variicola]HCI6138560.1 transposase [Klebsiella variicola subsp. variicola]HCI6659065.1 transposase [Klebsiella variicola subsp. variicola]